MSAKDQAGAAGETLLAMDHEVHAAVRPHRHDKAVRLIGRVSEIGDQPQLRLLSASAFVLGCLRGNPRLIGAGLRMLAAHELATAMKSAVKHRVDRRRPRSADGKDEETPHAGHASDKEESSFPSGHSAGALAAAAAFSAVYREYRAPALLGAGSVALAQIPRCAHYPTDVGAGLAIGALASGAVSLAWRLVRLSVPWWR